MYGEIDIMAGLKRKHHGELNKMDVPSWRYDQLRAKYANDSKALQQIDIYDPSTIYHRKLKKYTDALRFRQIDLIAKLETWFDEHYPDI